MSHNRTKFAVVVSSLIAVACAPGADPNGLPNAYANAYCHFMFHCCTPTERACFPTSNVCSTNFNGNGFLSTEMQLDFANEGECDQKLGDFYQTAAQQIQASVKDKRITWNQTAAQACIDALNKAGGSCDANAFQVALNGDPNSPGTLAACDTTTFTTGTVAAGGTCAISQDCQGQGSVCKAPDQPQTGTLVQAGGTCQPLPTATQSCQQTGQCEPGNSCCNAGTCVAFQAQGAVCVRGNGFFGQACSSQPCDPSKNFCGFTAGAYSCQVLIAGGQPCGKDQAGNDLNDSCASGQCRNGTCAAVQGTQVTYNICKGNPDGI